MKTIIIALFVLVSTIDTSCNLVESRIIRVKVSNEYVGPGLIFQNFDTIQKQDVLIVNIDTIGLGKVSFNDDYTYSITFTDDGGESMKIVDYNDIGSLEQRAIFNMNFHEGKIVSCSDKQLNYITFFVGTNSEHEDYLSSITNAKPSSITNTNEYLINQHVGLCDWINN